MEIRALLDETPVPVANPLQQVGLIPQEVPPIRNLDGLWCPSSDPCRIDLAPITGHNGNARMRDEPRCERRGGSIRQQIEHVVAF